MVACGAAWYSTDDGTDDIQKRDEIGLPRLRRAGHRSRPGSRGKSERIKKQPKKPRSQESRRESRGKSRGAEG